MELIKTLIVDDHYLVRRGLRDAFSQHKDIQVVGEASNGEEAISKAKELQPQVIIMDLHMPVMGGLEATRNLQVEVPQAYILILTVSDKEADLMAAMAAGARGYLLKDADSEDIHRAVLHIAEGGVLVSPTMAASLLSQLSAAGQESEAEGQTGLSRREKEVLQQLAKGATNKELAASLFITENTVKTHLRNIMEKLHLVNRSQMAAYAVRHGIHRPGDTQPPKKEE